jgi:cell division protein FtsW
MVSYQKERGGAGDKKIILYLFILVIFGLIVLTSASSPLGYTDHNGDNYFFIKKQILFGFLPGLVVFLILSKIPYQFLRKLTWLIYGTSVVLLGLVFVTGIGTKINSARSWLNLFGYSLQPSELAKLAIIIMLAYLLADRKIDWRDWKSSLAPILATLTPALFLILLQPDVGTLSILAVIIFVILYLAKVPNQHLIILGLLGVLCFAGLVIAAPYRVKRLTTFLHPEMSRDGSGYQINQAYLAIGSGGFWGFGYNQSRQKFQYLPEVNADSIYAVIAEELGFIPAALLVFLVLLIGCRGLKIAAVSPDQYGQFLVTGIMVWFMWQSFLNIGAMVGALPLTGVPLPFVSQGGTAYLSMFAAMGIVVNVSKFVQLENE